jgi:hypothetical protein
MNLLVSIPIAPYQALLGRCLLASREYALLKNSVINHVPTSKFATSAALKKNAESAIAHNEFA